MKQTEPNCIMKCLALTIIAYLLHTASLVHAFHSKTSSCKIYSHQGNHHHAIQHESNIVECTENIAINSQEIPSSSFYAEDEHYLQWRWTRRKMIVSSSLVLSLCSFVNQATADELTMSSLNDEPKECKNGGLVSESAVPGAYQQQCMDLKERVFRLQSTNDEIRIEQGASSTSGVSGKTGVAVWNSGVLLTRLLDKINQIDASILKGKTVVELGCGVGLASIAAAKLGASTVYATDANSDVLLLAQKNIELNNASNVKSVALQWGLLDAFEYDRLADVIIGSDLTYNPNTWRSLAESMATILKPGGIVIYLSLGHFGFNVSGELGGFTSIAENVGLTAVTNNRIESALPQILIQKERSVVDANGGVRVLVLTKR